VYTVNMNEFILLWSCIASGLLIRMVANRPLSFIALNHIAPIEITGGVYLADLIHMRNIVHSSSESWSGLFIPFKFRSMLYALLLQQRLGSPDSYGFFRANEIRQPGLSSH